MKPTTDLAEGTHPGNERRPRGLDALFEPAPSNDIAEILAAERDHVLDLLDRLERIIPPGYMTPEQQDVLREVKATLVEYGRRTKARPVWVDRVPR